MFNIGSHTIHNPVLLAPMAGVSDQPFRQLCHSFGAGLCVSEMLASKPELWDTKKSQHRFNLEGAGVKAVQLVGTEPSQLAESAKHYADLGAQIIDINMGCPAKKVCRKAAGSALMREPDTVQAICKAVVDAVDIPVTLKIRTGWCPDSRNALEIANIAQDTGIQSLVIHGRTRACRFKGTAEYDTIAAVKQAMQIPVIANGDICSPEQAKYVLDYTRADGVMVGRGAQGNPWLFQSISHYLNTGHLIDAPSLQQMTEVISQHMRAIEHFYGELLGMRISRKHVIAYFETHLATDVAKYLRRAFNQLEHCSQQQQFIADLEFHLHVYAKNNKQGIAA